MPPGRHGESAQKPLLQACLQRWFSVQIAHVTNVTWQFRNYLYQLYDLSRTRSVKHKTAGFFNAHDYVHILDSGSGGAFSQIVES